MKEERPFDYNRGDPKLKALRKNRKWSTTPNPLKGKKRGY